MLCRTFKLNRERAVDYLNMLDRLYVFDGFAGWEPEVCFVIKNLHLAYCYQPRFVRLHHRSTSTSEFAEKTSDDL